jgi:hypothetical protein
MKNVVLIISILLLVACNKQNEDLEIDYTNNISTNIVGKWQHEDISNVLKSISIYEFNSDMTFRAWSSEEYFESGEKYEREFLGTYIVNQEDKKIFVTQNSSTFSFNIEIYYLSNKKFIVYSSSGYVYNKIK